MLKSLCKSNSARRKFRTFTHKISALKRISTLINSNASFCDKGMEPQRCKIPMGTRLIVKERRPGVESPGYPCQLSSLIHST